MCVSDPIFVKERLLAVCLTVSMESCQTVTKKIKIVSARKKRVRYYFGEGITFLRGWIFMNIRWLRAVLPVAFRSPSARPGNPTTRIESKES